MIKVAILGCENSHANTFLKLMQEKEEFSHMQAIGVYSDDTAAAEKLRDTFGVAVMEHYADAVGKADGIIITARHGDNHYKYAKPYMDSGIPMFIDKPITVSEAEAVTFMKQLKEKNVKISGGSSLKLAQEIEELREDVKNKLDGETLSGLVRAPYQSENPYGGFYFYAQHLVEMVTSIFGKYPLTVTARKNGKQVHVLFHYENYDCVGLFCDGNYRYYACRMAEKGTKSLDIPSSNDWFYREFKAFSELFAPDAVGENYEDFIAPVFIMNAINRSMASGKEEPVGRCRI